MQSASHGGFLRITGSLGVGLTLAFELPGCAPRATGDAGFVPNAWVRIAPYETITVTMSNSEVGNGVATDVPTILADELDASIAHVRFACAPADPINADKPVVRTSAAELWLPLRQAGATARAMLMSAAAKTWGVDPSTCTARAGSVYHDPTKRKLTYGGLSRAAATLPIPTNVPLKRPIFALTGSMTAMRVRP